MESDYQPTNLTLADFDPKDIRRADAAFQLAELEALVMLSHAGCPPETAAMLIEKVRAQREDMMLRLLGSRCVPLRMPAEGL